MGFPFDFENDVPVELEPGQTKKLDLKTALRLLTTRFGIKTFSPFTVCVITFSSGRKGRGEKNWTTDMELTLW